MSLCILQALLHICDKESVSGGMNLPGGFLKHLFNQRITAGSCHPQHDAKIGSDRCPCNFDWLDEVKAPIVLCFTCTHAIGATNRLVRNALCSSFAFRQRKIYECKPSAYQTTPRTRQRPQHLHIQICGRQLLMMMYFT